MSRSKRDIPLSHIFGHPTLSRTSHTIKDCLAILGIPLIIFMLLGGRRTIPQPTYPDQVLADARKPLTTNKHAIYKQSESSDIELSAQNLQMTAGPERVSWLNINLANPHIHFGVVLANSHLSSFGEVLSSMANRTHALAGINGDYFDGMVNPIGLVEIDGQIVQSPGYYAVLGVTASKHITMGEEKLSGSVINGNASHVLNSINHHGDTHNGQLTLFTPALGTALFRLKDTIVTLRPVTASANSYIVQAIQSNATTLPRLSNQDALVGSGESSTWLVHNLHPGNRISITEHIVPDSNLVQAIGGGPVLIKNGALYKDPNPPAPAEGNKQNPLTAIAVNKDETHAFFVVFDGRSSGPGRSRGLTRAQMASYLLAHGAYQAMLFDGGGSSEMVARSRGQQKVAVINHPSDCHERRVANGLFVYER
jgi:exopolysaccharide biosynthesis protein